MPLSIFGIAMGMLEAIVVVYLRELFYPSGFHFPLVLFTPKLYLIEIARETATIVMLAMVGILAGKNKLQRFAWFLFSFAVWDIFYYVGLKVLLNWPPSLLSWDILFLIPINWVGPVLAPLLCSLSMILFSFVIIRAQANANTVKISLAEWGLFALGSLLIFITFIKDSFLLIIQNCALFRLAPPQSDQRFHEIISHYSPSHFFWLLFALGELFIIIGIFSIFKRYQYKR